MIFLGHHWPPQGLEIAKCLFYGSFQESHFRSVPKSQKIFGSHYMCGEVRNKKLGQKVNVKYFRVDPYRLGHRIPRVFQNLSDLHLRCNREQFYFEFLSQILSLYIWGSQENILGHKVNEKIFRVDPGRKKSKRVNKVLFPFPSPFSVIPKNGGL